MEEKKGLIDRFEELHDRGILIPCSHDTYNDTINPNSCSSSRKLEVRLNFDHYETLIYYHTNGRRMLSMRKLPTKEVHLINPFCILCRVDIAHDLLATKNRNDILVGNWLMKKLNHLSDGIWKRVESLKRQEQEGLDHESGILKRIEVSNLRLFRIGPDRVCNEEEFEECVATSDDFVEEEVPVIKGLERLSIDDGDGNGNGNDSEFLKREDTCCICLQKLKITDEKGDKDLKAPVNDDDISIVTKWSKSLTKLPCEHVFHEPCVLRCLYENRVCPLCQNSVHE